MSRAWHPVVDADACVGCGACLSLCEHGVYKPGAGGRPEVVYPLGCVTGCRGCQRLCPSGAISYAGDDGRPGIDYSLDTYRPELSCPGTRLPRVAFVCTHNSCRSQIAEALGRELARGAFESFSAGTDPGDRIDLGAESALARLRGIDMEASGQRPKSVSEIPAPDVVVFMGCGVRCPDVPSEYAEDWGLTDPTGGDEEAYRAVVDEVERRVRSLARRLSPEGAC